MRRTALSLALCLLAIACATGGGTVVPVSGSAQSGGADFSFVGPRDVVGWPHRIVYDPSDPAHSRVYAGGDDTLGLYRSDDGGATWQRLPAYEDGNARSAWALDVDPDGRVYAGDLYGLGVRVSDDGGATFTPAPGVGIDPDFAYISSVSASRSQPLVAYASVGFDSASDGQGGEGTPLSERGMLYKTIDGGETWTPVGGLPYNRPIQRVYVHPQDENIVVVARGISFESGDVCSIWRSIDGGVAWGLVSIPPDLYLFGAEDLVAGVMSDIMVASVGVYRPSTDSMTFEIWRSEDRGGTWAPANAPVSDFYYFSGVTAHPTSGVYAAFGFPADSGPGVLMSDDGLAMDWSVEYSAPPYSPYACGAFDPASPDEMLIGSFGEGIYRHERATGAWMQSAMGMAGACADGVAIDESTGRLMVTCGNLTFNPLVALSADGGATWQRQHLPGHQYSGVDATKLFIPSLADRTAPGVFVIGGPSVRRSDDAGDTWHEIPGPGTTYALSQGPDGSIYASGLDPWVYRSDDHGQSFASFGPKVPCGGPLSQPNVFVRADPHEADRVYLTCNDWDNASDGFWVKKGKRWSALRGHGLPADEETLFLAIDPAVAGRLAAITGREFHDGEGNMVRFESHAFVSTDDGTTWTDLTPTINRDVPDAIGPCARAKAVLYLSDGPGHLVVGTASYDEFCPQTNGRLLESFDNGQTWEDATANLIPAHVYDNGIFEDPLNPGGLYVATWYSGVFWRPPLAQPPPTPTPTPDPGGDVIPPDVSITQPIDGGQVPRGSVLTILADASDDVGVVRVEFSVDGVLLCSDESAAYSCDWRVPGKPNALYSVSAVAYDAAGNSASHEVSVTAPM